MLKVVKPCPAPNWPLQPEVTCRTPHMEPRLGAWLAGVLVQLLPTFLVWNWQGVVAVPSLMPKVQVQTVSAVSQTLFTPMKARWPEAAMEWKGAAMAVPARRVRAAVAVNFILKGFWRFV